MPHPYARAVLGLLLAATLFGCSTSPPPAQTGVQSSVKVTDIDVGRSIAADKTIADKTDSFRPTDIFYVSVKTEGSAPSATLTARWTYQDGQVVDNSSQTIAPIGPAVTEFHLSKPSAWPVGDYKVEVLLNSASAGTKSFTVK
jgi:hypothetical protein